MMNLREATREALRTYGFEILTTPRRLVGYMTDLIDTDTPEAQVLYAGCDERFCGLLYDAAQQATPQALLDAAVRASDYLQSRYVLEAHTSQAVSWEVTAGVADALDIIMPEWSETGIYEQQAYRVVTQPSVPPISAPPQQPSITVVDTSATYQGDTSQGSYVVPDQPVMAHAYQDTYGTSPAVQPSTPPATPGPEPRPEVVYVDPGTGTQTQTDSRGINKGLIVALVAVLAGALVLVMFSIGGFGGGSKGSSSGSRSMTPSVTTDETSEDDGTTFESTSDTEGSSDTVLADADATDGTINGLRYHQKLVNDVHMGRMRAVFVHNESSQNLSVTSPTGSTYIPAIPAGGDGFFLMPTDGAISEQLNVEATTSWSPCEYCDWYEESRDGDIINFVVTNNGGMTFSFDRYFYFVAGTQDSFSYTYSEWYYTDGTSATQLAPGDTAFEYLDEDGVVSAGYDYNLYINGVKINRRY